MSADLTITDTTGCANCDSFEANWTYSLSPMQRAAIGTTLHDGEPGAHVFIARLFRLHRGV